MRKLYVLLKLNFRALLSSFTFGKGRKRKMGMAGSIMLLGGIAAYISIIYSNLIGDTLADFDMLDSMLPLMAIMACLMALMMTVFAASGFVFGGKDSDLMLSLPVNAFTVMLSKLLAVYIENFVFCALWMLSTGVIYIIYGGTLSIGYIIGILVTLIFMPFIPSLLCMIIGFIIAWFSAHTKKNVIVSNVLYFAFFALIFIGSSQMSRISTLLVDNNAQFNAVLDTWLLPFGLLRDMLTTTPTSALWFMLICIVPFIAVTYIFSTNYKKLLTLLAAHKTRSDYKLVRYGSSGQFKALLKKEFARFFGSTIYVFNSAFGAAILIIGTVAAVIMKSRIEPVIDMIGGLEYVTSIFAAVIIFMVATINTTCVSISLEGKTLWILKEAPVTPSSLFGAKAAVNIIVALVSSCLATFIIGAVYGVSPLAILVIILACIATSACIATAGLWINLLLPKMNGINDTVIVKQSASAVVSVFAGMGAAAIAGVLLVVLQLPIITFCLVYSLILAIIAFVLWKLLMKFGYIRLMNI